MKRLLLILLFLLLPAGDAFPQGRSSPPVEFKKISERLYEITGGSGANGGAYIGDNGVLMIDAKMDEESVNRVLDGVKRITDKPILYLVNTHSDGDHVRGNRYSPGSVVIIAHENCRKEFFHPTGNGSESEWKSPELSQYIPAITFRDKMDLYLGSKKVELWYFGVGHTTGDAVVYFPEEKTAFIGDQYFFGRPQLIHSYKGGNSFGHVQNLTRMLETLDAEHFASGHSDMAGRAEIQRHIEAMKQCHEKVKALIGKKRNLDEIKVEFAENEASLIETIYAEIQNTGR